MSSSKPTTSPPSYPTQPQSPQPKTHDDMFPSPTWNDLWAAILFYVHLGGLAAIAAYAFTLMPPGRLLDKNDPSEPGHHGALIAMNFAVSIGGAAVLTALLLFFMYRRPETFIHASMIGYVLASAIFSGLAFMRGAFYPAVMFAVVAIIGIVVYFSFRKKIPFSAIILKTVIDGLKAYPAMLNVTFGSLLFIIPIVGLDLTALASLAAYSQQSKDSTGPFIYFSIIYILFSFFWTQQVITNVVQTTIAGVYATYYFLHGTGQAVGNPTIGSLSRSLTYSFGSICFGSLIVATIQTIRMLLRMATDRNSIMGMIADCIIGMIEGLVRYFNYLAYTHIAIYGKSYIQAAKDAWSLLKSRGLDVVVNDNIIGTVTFMASLMVGLITGLSSGLLTLGLFSVNANAALGFGFLFGILSIFISMLVFQILAAGSTATFVCLAEDPAAMQKNKPELYNAILEKYGSITF